MHQPTYLLPKSRLRPFITDDDETGVKNSVLVIKGFKDKNEIQEFMTAMQEQRVIR